MSHFGTGLMIILYVFLTYIALDHMINLTKFVFKYNSSYDYGHALKNMCKKEYFEYESQRFQVADNDDNIKMPNDNYQYYMIAVLIIARLVSFGIASLFTFVLYYAFYNSKWLNQTLGIDDNSTTFIRVIFESIKKIKQFDISYLPVIIYVGLTYIILLAVPIMSILQFTLQFANVTSLSPFAPGNAAFGVYIALFAIILFMRVMPFFNIFGEKLKNYYPQNRHHIISFAAVFSIYIMSFYFIDKITYIYRSNDVPDTGNIGTVGTDKFYERIFNTDVIPTIGIVLVVMLVIYGLIRVLNLDDTGNNEKYLMVYGAISVLVVLLIALVAVNNATEFNASVNKYLVTEPVHIYKEDLVKINDLFNDILYNEHKQAEGNVPEYICRNVGNAILMTLYSGLFNGFDTISKNGTDKDYLDITPEFMYDKKCESLEPYKFANKCDFTKSCDFKEQNEYDISYYLNGKSAKKSIFYRFDQCTIPNDMVLKRLSENLKVDITKDIIMQSISNILVNKVYYDKNTSLESIQDTNEVISILNSYKVNNAFVEVISSVTGTTDSEKYSKKVDKILELYTKMKLDINDIFKKHNNITKTEIKEITDIITKAFEEINKILAEPISDNILNNDVTKYIISNYNSIITDEDDVYKKKLLAFNKQPVDDQENKNKATLYNTTQIMIKLQKSYTALNDLYDKLYNHDMYYYDTHKEKVKDLIPSDKDADNLADVTMNYANYDSEVKSGDKFADVIKKVIQQQNDLYSKIGTYSKSGTEETKKVIAALFSKIDKTLRSLKLDYDTYVIKQNDAKKNTVVITTRTRKDALAERDKMQKVNELVYAMGFNYVLLFLAPLAPMLLSWL